MNKPLLLRRSSLVWLALFLLNLSFIGSASASSTTTLLSEDFSNAFPPTGWTTSDGTSWYSSYAGNGGKNGSVMIDLWNYATGSLNTPSIDVTEFTGVADTAYIEFDFFMERNYYNDAYNSSDWVYVTFNNGSTSETVKTFATLTDYTYYYENYDYDYDPSMDNSAWAHYKIGIPADYRTKEFSVSLSGAPDYGLSNSGFDNFSIVGTHYFNISYTPATLSFGGIDAGDTSATQCVTITNPNIVPIQITSQTFTGTNPGDFLVSNLPTEIPAASGGTDGQASFCIAFAPQANGHRTATVNLGTTSDNLPLITVNVGGDGVAPSIKPSTPGPLFAKTAVRIGHSRTVLLGITNVGQGALVIKPTSYISGENPSSYTITRWPVGGIAPGAWDTIGVTFSPVTEGANFATLNILSNSQDGPIAIDLRASGVLPRISVVPSGVITFEPTGLGVQACQTVTVTNPGTDTLVITGNYFSSNDGDFTWSALQGNELTLLPGALAKTQICFMPLRTGTRQARLRFTTNIPRTFDSPSRDTSSLYIDVTGIGAIYGILNAKSITVDSTIVGTQGCAADTIWNTGLASVTINSLSLTTADARIFDISGNTLPMVVPAGGSQIIHFCATPNVRGNKTALLTINGTTANEALSTTLPLIVDGLIACQSADQQAIFGHSPILLAKSDTAKVTISNCGDVTNTYTAAVITGASVYSILGSPTSAPTAPGATATFTVIFNPNDIGAIPGTLSVSTANASAVTVELDGVGAGAKIAAVADAVPSTNVNTTSGQFGITLTNTGNVAWTPGTPTVAGPFAYVSGADVAIPANGVGTVFFTFAPTVVGTANGTVSFPNDSPGLLSTLSVPLSGIGLPTNGVSATNGTDGISLMQNYPNPFTSATSVQFAMPNEARVMLTIADARGGVVKSMDLGAMSAGTHSIAVEANDLASGTYYYTLEVGNTRITRQMVLVR